MQPVPGTALREETRGEMAGETPEKFGCLNKKWSLVPGMSLF